MRLLDHSPRAIRQRLLRAVSVTALAAIAAACSSDSTGPTARGFLDGTSTNPQIGVVLNSTGKSLVLFQLGSPDSTRQLALGTSSTVTPVGFSIRGHRVAVPLGDAASVALVDLDALTAQRFFLFARGNATGSAFVDDTTVIAANLLGGYVGKFTVGQTSDSITDTVTVAPAPTAVAIAGGRAFIISANYDANYNTLGNGIVTAIDPATMHVLGSVETGGTNASDAAVGPDGKLYVLNTGDYVDPGSVTIIDPSTLSVVSTVPNMGVGPGAISIDSTGLAYISGFYFGTIVWNTQTQTFVRGADDPVCAPIAAGGCRGAFASTADAAGDLYQAFFGSAADGLPPYVFVYHVGSYALTDSVTVGSGPAAIAIRTF